MEPNEQIGELPWLPTVERRMREIEAIQFQKEAGMSPAVAAPWADAGFGPNQTRTAVGLGLGLDEAIARRDRLAVLARALPDTTPSELSSWVDSGFADEDTLGWAKAGWRFAEAKEWLEGGWSLEEVARWNPPGLRSDRISPPEVRQWTEVGAGPDEARRWRGRGLSASHFARIGRLSTAMASSATLVCWGHWRMLYITADRSSLAVSEQRLRRAQVIRNSTTWAEIYRNLNSEAIESELGDVLDDWWLEECRAHGKVDADGAAPQRPSDFRPSGPLFMRFARKARLHPISVLSECKLPFDCGAVRGESDDLGDAVWSTPDELCEVAGLASSHGMPFEDRQQLLDRLMGWR